MRFFVFIFYFLILFVIFFDAYFIEGILKEISNELMVTLLEASYLVSAYSFSMAILTPIIFFIVKVNYRIMFVLSLLGFLLSNIFSFFLFDKFLYLVWSRLFAGLFSGILISLCVTMASSAFKKMKSEYLLGYSFSSIPISIMLGIPLGIIIYSTFSIKSIFILISLITIFLLIIYLYFIPKFEFDLDDVEKIEFYVIKSKMHILCSSFLYTLASYIIFIYLSEYTSIVLDLSLNDRSLLFFISGCSGILFSLLSAFIIRTIGIRLGVVFSCSLFIISMLLLYLIDKTSILIYVSSFLYGGALFLVIPIYQIYFCDALISEAETSFLLSLNNSLSCLATVLAGFVGGYIINIIGIYYLPFFSIIFSFMAMGVIFIGDTYEKIKL